MEFANLPSRIKAVTIDSFLLIIFMYVFTLILDGFENVPDGLKVGFVLAFLVYEPIFISVYGGTIGHFYSKIEVKQEQHTNRNIPLGRAFLRYLVKLTLGWMSLLTVTTNEHKKAIHDYVGKSVVLDVQE